jgi:hypothetical protein
MLQEESIYNLLPKEKIEVPKDPIYRSKYPHSLAPTASTFCLKNSSFPGIANLNGEVSFPRGAHPIKGASTTFGRPSGSYKVDPENFIKKNHEYKTLPPPEKLHPDTIRKPSVPTLKDKPIMGLKSDKNYITANAVDIILMQPKKRVQEQQNYLQKKSYGKVPNYLNKLKNEIENEYKTIREMQLRTEEEEARKKKTLSEEEIISLRDGLERKLKQLKQMYGVLTHKKSFDTLVMLKK